MRTNISLISEGAKHKFTARIDNLAGHRQHLQVQAISEEPYLTDQTPLATRLLHQAFARAKNALKGKIDDGLGRRTLPLTRKI